MVVSRMLLLGVGLILSTIRPIDAGDESASAPQTCVSQFAQATCMGPWFGWNEPTHLNQGKNCLRFIISMDLT